MSACSHWVYLKSCWNRVSIPIPKTQFWQQNCLYQHLDIMLKIKLRVTSVSQRLDNKIYLIHLKEKKMVFVPQFVATSESSRGYDPSLRKHLLPPANTPGKQLETIKHVLVNSFQGNGYAPAMGGFSPTVALSKEDMAQLLLNNHCCRSLGNNSQGTREALCKFYFPRCQRYMGVKWQKNNINQNTGAGKILKPAPR